MNIGQVLIFIIPYVLGLSAMVLWRRKKEEPKYFFYFGSWTLVALSTYLGIVESKVGSFLWVIPLLLFLAFFLSYRHEKTYLRNGLLFNLFIITFGIYLLFNFTRTANSLVAILILLVGVLVVAVAIFGLTGLTILLYWNAIVVIRRESRSLPNLLTLIAAIGLSLWLIYDHFIASSIPDWLSLLIAILPAGLFYFALVFFNFLTVSILYQFNQPTYKQDFVIVLGAGLMDGEKVSPLLAKRIDRAIAFYHQQQKHGRPPKLIMSGGQGADETIPEAIAMKKYALAQNIPDEDILVETRSKTTFENMKFSKEIIQNHTEEKAKVIFSSNNYHIFRAGIFARLADLKADGIGAKTALYYLPNAFLREFIAIVAMHKKRHIVVVSMISIVLVLFSLMVLIVPYLTQ